MASPPSFLALAAGIGLGTSLEWYDFSLYSGLSGTITANFFPSGNEATAALAYWGVFAAGFVTRPIGALLLGHVGDTAGRRWGLLISITAMAIPTVLIGCLPTYAMIGYWAPALLVLLRVVQGLAVGGEFGTAMTYMSEITPQGTEGRTGAFMFGSANFGVAIGNVAVMIVMAACSPEQLAVWGWRIPFLAAIFTASLALLLRLQMPESREFVAARKALESGVDPKDITATGFAHPDTHPDAEMVIQEESAGGKPGVAPAPLKGWQRFMALPAVILFKHHWVSVLLQVMFDLWPALTFYTFTAWLPTWFKLHGVAPITAQGMVVTALMFTLITLPLSGYGADRGMPLLWTAASVAVVGTGAVFGAQAVFGLDPFNLAATWVMQAVVLALLGLMQAVIPAACTRLYPAIARTSGYSLAHNLAFGVLGGLTPMVITAIDADLGKSGGDTLTYAPAWWILAGCAATVLASLAIRWYAPHCNYTQTQWERRQEADDTATGGQGRARGVV